MRRGSVHGESMNLSWIQVETVSVWQKKLVIHYCLLLSRLSRLTNEVFKPRHRLVAGRSWCSLGPQVPTDAASAERICQCSFDCTTLTSHVHFYRSRKWVPHLQTELFCFIWRMMKTEQNDSDKKMNGTITINSSLMFSEWPMFPLKPLPAMQRPKTPQWWSKFTTSECRRLSQISFHTRCDLTMIDMSSNLSLFTYWFQNMSMHDARSCWIFKHFISKLHNSSWFWNVFFFNRKRDAKRNCKRLRSCQHACGAKCCSSKLLQITWKPNQAIYLSIIHPGMFHLHLHLTLAK